MEMLDVGKRWLLGIGNAAGSKFGRPTYEIDNSQTKTRLAKRIQNPLYSDLPIAIPTRDEFTAPVLSKSTPPRYGPSSLTDVEETVHNTKSDAVISLGETTAHRTNCGKYTIGILIPLFFFL